MPTYRITDYVRILERQTYEITARDEDEAYELHCEGMAGRQSIKHIESETYDSDIEPLTRLHPKGWEYRFHA